MPECEKCNELYKKGDRFCSKCGAKIETKPKVKQPKTKPGKKVVVPEQEAAKEDKKEISEDVKRKLKAELEIAIKAFKRGDITLEEFQDIKKSIVAKAKAGFYDQPKAVEDEEATVLKIGRQLESLTPDEPKRAIEHLPTGDLYRPMRRKDEAPFNKLWFIAPILLNIFGGIVAYFALKPVDEKAAKKMIAIGALSLVVVAAGVGYYLNSQDLLPSGKKDTAVTGIVIEGEEVTEVVSATPIIASNASAEEMNLVAGDLGVGFNVVPIRTGTLVDSLEFTGGNATLARDLEAQGWIENHRIVLEKNLETEGNKTVKDMEVDSSISKFDANKTSSAYFAERLDSFKQELEGSGFVLSDLEINASGVIGKKVDPDPDFDIKVTYQVSFYKKDALVTMRITKLGRGLTEGDVNGYAEEIESRIV